MDPIKENVSSAPEIPVVEKGGKDNVLEKTLSHQSEKISELVGKSPAEDTTSGTDDQPAKISAPIAPVHSFFHRVQDLIFSSKAPREFPPRRKDQEKYIKKALNQERARLLKKIKKIENNRNFSAAKLEQTLLQIRSLQKLIESVVYMATKQLKSLYQKYVIKSD